VNGPQGSKFDEYRAKGREAETRATLSNDPEIKRQFADIARQWFELAKRVKRTE
jgi:hypothetical protein